MQDFNFTGGETETTEVILLLQPILPLLRYPYVWHAALFNGGKEVYGCKYIFVHTLLHDFGDRFYLSSFLLKIVSALIGLSTKYNELNGQDFCAFKSLFKFSSVICFHFFFYI